MQTTNIPCTKHSAPPSFSGIPDSQRRFHFDDVTLRSGFKPYLYSNDGIDTLTFIY